MIRPRRRLPTKRPPNSFRRFRIRPILNLCRNRFSRSSSKTHCGEMPRRLNSASDQFEASLQDAAAANRIRLLGSASDIIGGGTNHGIGLVTGSRENPLSFQRGSTQTTQKEYGLGDYLMAIGGGLQSAASL